MTCASAERPYLREASPTPRPEDPFDGATVGNIDRAIATLSRAMTSLGSTSGLVARRLAAMKCVGERGNPSYCPLIAYLAKQRIGKYRLLLLGGGWLEIAARDGWNETIRVPVAVETFAARFDRGGFPACAAETSGPGSDPAGCARDEAELAPLRGME